VEKYCTAGQATDGSIIGRMRVACWMIDAKDTHSEYAIMVTRERHNVTFTRKLPIL